MSEIVYVESSSEDESYVESSSEDGANEKVAVSTREVKNIKESNQLILATFADKEKQTMEEIEALKKCKDYWQDIAATRLQNLEMMTAALDSQAKRIHELETSISDAKAEEIRAKKARFDTCKPQLDSTSSTQYGIVVHGIPTTMNLCSKEEIQFFQDENFGLLKSLQSIKWINPGSLHGGKVNSSIVIFLSNSVDFEMLLQRKCLLYGAQSKPVKRFVANFQGGKARCFKCDGLGHFARDCPQPEDNDEDDGYDEEYDDRCFTCHGLGHFARDCPQPEDDDDDDGYDEEYDDEDDDEDVGEYHDEEECCCSDCYSSEDSCYY